MGTTTHTECEDEAVTDITGGSGDVVEDCKRWPGQVDVRAAQPHSQHPDLVIIVMVVRLQLAEEWNHGFVGNLSASATPSESARAVKEPDKLSKGPAPVGWTKGSIQRVLPASSRPNTHDREGESRTLMYYYILFSRT